MASVRACGAIVAGKVLRGNLTVASRRTGSPLGGGDDVTGDRGERTKSARGSQRGLEALGTERQRRRPERLLSVSPKAHPMDVES